MIENGADIVSHTIEWTVIFRALWAWLSDPAALTAIASLLTAVAAFFKVRHVGADHLDADMPKPAGPDSSRGSGFDIEDRIREVLLLQLQNLEEKADSIDQDLAAYQQANAALKGLIKSCSVPFCPVRGEIERDR